LTKSRSVVLAIAAMILALAGATAAYAAPSSAPSASRGPTVNLAAASKGCAVVHVALHGTRAPSITCSSRAKRPNSSRPDGKVIPDTGPSDCYGTLNVIDSDGTYCFSGSGYLGLNPDLYLVGDIDAQSDSWVRIYYNGGGTYFNMSAGNNEFFLGPGEAFENVKLTQICDDCGYHS
jgi:hypothetical protein